jgi:hypothetical protein
MLPTTDLGSVSAPALLRFLGWVAGSPLLGSGTVQADIALFIAAIPNSG